MSSSPLHVQVVSPSGSSSSGPSSFEQDADALYPALFEWTQECSAIGITGSFNKYVVLLCFRVHAQCRGKRWWTNNAFGHSWGSHLPLAEVKSGDKDENAASVWAITLYLPEGTHFFKYNVDNAWKYDPEVAFAPDEYGNINNFITITAEVDALTKQKKVHRPIRTMLRDGNNKGLPVMNPVATKQLEKIRLQTSPVLRAARSPARHSMLDGHNLLTTEALKLALTPMPKPLVPEALREPRDAEDSEYGLNVDDMNHVPRGARSRSGTLTRSKSVEMMVHGITGEEPVPKYANSMDNGIPSSVLLAATTQHFGGDLVTQEHAMRAELGGHRSLVTFPHEGNTKRSKMILVLVGLPGRGKTFIGHILARHLTWIGHHSKVFNLGEYRRRLVGSSMNHVFWDPHNEESVQIRTDLAKQCLDDAMEALKSDACDCVVYDATNATSERRNMLLEDVQKKFKCEMMFIESICDDPELIASSINEMKLNSEDYAGQTMDEAAADYSNRIRHYLSVYEPLNAERDNYPFIKVIDVGRQIFCNQVYGYLQSRIMFLMANLQLRPRPIWLSRHGESMFNTQKRIGGDAPLSPLGQQYATQLDRFVNAYYPAPDTELAVWTSTMLRTGMTVERIAARGRPIVKWKQLDEIDAGVCDGMTYEQVAEEMPEEYLARKNNKLHYRYPRGESYQDVIHRLEPVITELMRMDRPVLIVAHQAILRVLYAYLTNKDPSECPTLNIPLHVVIQLTPKAYQCEEVWHRPM